MLYGISLVKAVRWSSHALKNLIERDIERQQAERTLTTPEAVVPGQVGRKVFMRRYFDAMLQQEMLLRVVVEETTDEIAVVTIYKTSQLDKYLRGLKP